ncbi:MAG TPA: hypothetical protein VGG64_03295 [Pirellulales bacterium]
MKALPMPADDRGGLDHDQCRPPATPYPREPDPKHPVTRPQLRSPGFPVIGGQLLPQGEVFGHQRCLTAGERPQGGEEQVQRFDHGTASLVDLGMTREKS